MKRVVLLKQWYKEVDYIPLHTILVSVLCVAVYFTPWDTTNLYISTPLFASNQSFHVFTTAALVHVNHIHLWNNLLIVVTFGALLEIVHGNLVHVLVFWISSTSGCLTEAFLRSLDNYHIKGSSAGVYGILGAYLAHCFINWKEAPLKVFWISMLAIVALSNILSYATDLEYRHTVGHWAHIVGAAQGTFLGLFLLKNIKVRRFEQTLELIGYLASSSILLWPFVYSYLTYSN
jgi:membrane associated rhomboid family serine protease